MLGRGLSHTNCFSPFGFTDINPKWSQSINHYSFIPPSLSLFRVPNHETIAHRRSCHLYLFFGRLRATEREGGIPFLYFLYNYLFILLSLSYAWTCNVLSFALSLFTRLVYFYIYTQASSRSPSPSSTEYKMDLAAWNGVMSRQHQRYCQNLIGGIGRCEDITRTFGGDENSASAIQFKCYIRRDQNVSRLSPPLPSFCLSPLCLSKKMLFGLINKMLLEYRLSMNPHVRGRRSH